MRRCWPFLVVTALLVETSDVSGQDTPPAPTERFADVPSLSPVTDGMLRDPDPGDWLSWRRTLDAWGYSPLDEIDRENVADLALAWSRPLSGGFAQEGTPLVHEGVLFMPNPRDVIQAIDAASGDLYWQYRRPLPDDLEEQFVIFAATNRNVAIYGNLIIGTSSDDYVFALDARTGTVVWETRILDYRAGALQTSGPIVADGRVISGRGCEPAGGPDACVITAHDALTGTELWRRRTIPAPGEPGDETWGGVPFEERHHVGTWMVPSYDPELNLVYVGTSVTSPAPKYLLAGNDDTYLYHNSTLALDAARGEIVWFYQHVVDHWDMDHPFERILLDTVLAPDPSEVPWISPNLEPGERRRVMTGIPGKTGVVYTLDRETGEFLWARPTVTQNVITDIDGASGQVTVNPETRFTAVNQRRLVCPGSGGGKNWPAGAYSPRTGLMYFPLQQACQSVTSTLEEPSPDRSLYGIRREREDPPGGRRGTVHAISVETGRTSWEFEEEARTFSLVATAGGLLFGGDDNGRFRALDDRTGEVLWEVNLGSPVLGFPISYAANGKQYVATSVGGMANTLFVFALPD
ncbi:MAG: PQQ-binding-like beta-propeller repeat protein [Longimicrobiales bacterium]|nr:PQQ-binding-like beta-propeller repeat protein [Longimicrobiales bacterium]